MSLWTERNIKALIRSLVELYYDDQDTRMRGFSRLRAVNLRHFVEQNGRKPTKEEKLAMLKEFIATTGIDPNITLALEKQIRNYLRNEVKDVPIVKHFLSQIRGFGPILSAGLYAYFNPYGNDANPADHPSSFIKYAGLHVDKDGKAIRKERDKKLEFNPKVRVLLWKVAASFLKAHTEPYADIYYHWKPLEIAKLNNPLKDPRNCPLYEGCAKRLKAKAERVGREPKAMPCKAHIHYRACRHMQKRFLIDFWIQWRQLEGLPVNKPYAVAVLGHEDHPEIHKEKECPDCGASFDQFWLYGLPQVLFCPHCGVKLDPKKMKSAKPPQDDVDLAGEEPFGDGEDRPDDGGSDASEAKMVEDTWTDEDDNGVNGGGGDN